jgi:predicted XRE-type DNA-binding protein
MHKLARVTTRLEIQKLRGLIDQSGMTDRELERLFGVAQSTVWRLKHGKIQKIQWYIAKLEAAMGVRDRATDEQVVSELDALSRHSPEMRRILRSLHALMQESA